MDAITCVSAWSLYLKGVLLPLQTWSAAKWLHFLISLPRFDPFPPNTHHHKRLWNTNALSRRSQQFVAKLLCAMFLFLLLSSVGIIWIAMQSDPAAYLIQLGFTLGQVLLAYLVNILCSRSLRLPHSPNSFSQYYYSYRCYSRRHNPISSTYIGSGGPIMWTGTNLKFLVSVVMYLLLTSHWESICFIHFFL